MKIVYLLLIIFTQTFTYAMEVSQVVKVSSGVCRRSSGYFQGSGLGFSHAGKNYVLTSEHVVIHGNGSYCHFVWNETYGKVSAQLVAFEYGNGLALLELSETVELFADFNTLAVAEAVEGNGLNVMGFPFAQRELISNNHGRVLVGSSARRLIPLVPRLIETMGAHGEFGMSGGPVVSENRDLMGVLSHQYIRLVPGRKTTVANFSQHSRSENHLLIIPAFFALSWVKTVLESNGKFVPYFVRDPEEQIKNREVILTSGLRFEFIEKAQVVKPIGGADGAGTGGADGVGTGGTETDSLSGMSAVRLKRDTSLSPTEWYLPEMKKWLVGVQGNLRLPWNIVEIPFFLSSTEESIEAFTLDSLADFFQKLARRDLEPVTILSSRSRNNEGTVKATTLSKAEIELEVQGEHLSELVSTLQKLPLSSETQWLLSRAEIVAKLLTSKSWLYLRRNQLESLCNVKDHPESWKPLFINHFELAVNLLERLNKINQLLGLLKT